MKNTLSLSAIRRFDCVASATIHPAEDTTLPACLELQFWGQPDDHDKAIIERECREAGLTLDDSYSTDLGLHRRYLLPIVDAGREELADRAQLDDDDVDDFERRVEQADENRRRELEEEAICEGRRHRPALVNPHGD